SHRGQVKVLDFGLAKLLHHGGDAVSMDSLSETQGMTGTLPYMAPEQLLLGKVDPRTDLYALGALLYEMVTGRRPFRERNTIMLANSILHQPPPKPREINPEVSVRLEAVILKCLEKDPDDRYESAADLRSDLMRAAKLTPAGGLVRVVPPKLVRPLLIGAAVVLGVSLLGLGLRQAWPGLIPGLGPARIRSIAVLPLENLSGDPEQEYFADGMTDELITDLARIGALRVISRTSVMRYKKQSEKNLPQIARELNVDAIVEGSVMRFGDQVRITAQLVQSSTDEHLWAESYDRSMGDVLGLQSEVARKIAEQIQIKLTPREKAGLSAGRVEDQEVHEIYLKGHYYAGQPDAGSLRN